MINTDDGQFLLKLARSAIETYLNDGRIINVPQDINPHLKRKGVFCHTPPRWGIKGLH